MNKGRLSELVSRIKGIFTRLFLSKKYCYIGNGATSINESALAGNRKVDIDKDGPGLRKYKIRSNKILMVSDQNLFFRNETVLTGYYAAIKKDGFYYWYTNDENWHTLSELNKDEQLERRLFSPAQTIDCELKSRRHVVYLFAQWNDIKEGQRIRGGYHIFKNQLMAHALGTYKGQRYTNTREALENSYAEGYRYLETDVSVTEDQRLVLSHGWDEDSCKVTGMEYKPEFEYMTRDMFLKQTIKGAHTMSIEDLRDFMREHEDTCFELDLHYVDMQIKIPLLLEAFEYDETLLNRLLIQAESREICHSINQIYHFDNCQVLFGDEWNDKLEEVITYALDNGIETIGMRQKWWKKEAAELFHAAGINTMAYTVQKSVKRVKTLLDMGIDTVCTDKVKPEDISQ